MPKVDLQFRLIGDNIPVDHGYHLFSVVSKVVPTIHENRDIGLHPINGRLTGNRLMALTERSRLTLRTPVENIESLLTLAGKTLRIADYDIRVGVPNVRALVPSPRLYSRLVIVKGFMEPDGFLQAVEKQLLAMGVRGTPSLIKQSRIPEANRGQPYGSHSEFLRRTIRIRGKEIVGFAVSIGNLTPEDSIRVQEEGVGGRRRFGCGIFIPYKQKEG